MSITRSGVNRLIVVNATLNYKVCAAAAGCECSGSSRHGSLLVCPHAAMQPRGLQTKSFQFCLDLLWEWQPIAFDGQKR